jgi:hypothetical protein
MSGSKQSKPHGQMDSPSHFMPGSHSESDQQPPATGTLQMPCTHGLNDSSPQSMSVVQQPGMALHESWPAALHSHEQPLETSCTDTPEQAAQTTPPQPDVQVLSGWHSQPSGPHDSHASGAPQHVPAGQSAGFTVPDGHTHAPFLHSADAGK